MPAIPLGETARADLATAVVRAVSREYPHMLIQELNSDADVVPPRELNPSFFGSYDWHSAVHCHWTLVRCLATGLPTEVSGAVVAVLDQHLSEAPLSGEFSFYSGPGGRVAERPYGWAWLVMLHAECRRLASSSVGASVAEAGRRWTAALEPLNALLRDRLVQYFSSALAFPIRAGTHGNTAFSLELLHQAAGAAGDTDLARAASAAARHWFAEDALLPWRGPLQVATSSTRRWSRPPSWPTSSVPMSSGPGWRRSARSESRPIGGLRASYQTGPTRGRSTSRGCSSRVLGALTMWEAPSNPARSCPTRRSWAGTPT